MLAAIRTGQYTRWVARFRVSWPRSGALATLQPLAACVGLTIVDGDPRGHAEIRRKDHGLTRHA